MVYIKYQIKKKRAKLSFSIYVTLEYLRYVADVSAV
jgi:hypothetical protein